MTDYVKDTAVGYLMEKEIKYLGKRRERSRASLHRYSGRRQVADKLNVISNLLEKVDTLIIGAAWPTPS